MSKKKEAQPPVVIYTDGSAKPNPGPGGYGFVVYEDGKEVTHSKGYYHTTNNRMEIMAIIAAVKEYGDKGRLIIHTDSTYAMKGCQSWAKSWARNNWLTFAGTPVQNADLWREALSVLKGVKATYVKVKAHSGIPGNEAADKAAKYGTENPTEHDHVFEAQVSR